MDVKRFQELKDEIEGLAREQSKAEGGMENIVKTLKGQFSIRTIKEAKKLLKKKATQAQEMEERANLLMDVFEAEYKDQLEKQ